MLTAAARIGAAVWRTSVIAFGALASRLVKARRSRRNTILECEMTDEVSHIEVHDSSTVSRISRKD